MAEQDQDKSEQATPFKLEEARRRGQVVKSLDVNSLFIVAGSLALFSVSGMRFLAEGLSLQRDIFEQAPIMRFEISDLMHWFSAVATATGFILAPFFVMILVIAVLSNLVQTGPVFTFFPLKPDPKRMSPVQGFKRVFSRRALFEAFKTLLKLSLLVGVAYAVIVGMLPSLMAMPQIDPHGYPTVLFGAISSLLFKLTLVLLVIALLDFAYTRWDYAKRMRMSRRELKDEVKRREGDPHVRAKIKELQREAAKRSKSLGRVPDADVLITNPTHFAVALQYQREAMKAPRLIAKGAGETAEKMKAVARRYGIPVLERPPLARQLFREVDIDAPIPEAVYEPIARIYAEIYQPRHGAVRVGVEA